MPPKMMILSVTQFHSFLLFTNKIIVHRCDTLGHSLKLFSKKLNSGAATVVGACPPSLLELLTTLLRRAKALQAPRSTRPMSIGLLDIFTFIPHILLDYKTGLTSTTSATLIRTSTQLPRCCESFR